MAKWRVELNWSVEVEADDDFDAKAKAYLLFSFGEEAIVEELEPLGEAKHG